MSSLSECLRLGERWKLARKEGRTKNEREIADDLFPSFVFPFPGLEGSDPEETTSSSLPYPPSSPTVSFVSLSPLLPFPFARSYFRFVRRRTSFSFRSSRVSLSFASGLTYFFVHLVGSLLPCSSAIYPAHHPRKKAVLLPGISPSTTTIAIPLALSLCLFSRPLIQSESIQSLSTTFNHPQSNPPQRPRRICVGCWKREKRREGKEGRV